MSAPRGFSIDINGEWSTRQAEAILKIVGPEGEAMGLEVRTIDISTFERAERRIFSLYCRRHDCYVAKDSACERCIKEDV